MPNLLELPTFVANRRQHGFATDFYGPPTKQVATYVAALLANDADLSATIIFTAPAAVRIHDISIIPDGTTSGIDDSNTSAWVVTNGTSNVAAKTYNTATVFPADSVADSLGTVALNTLAVGGRLELAITNGTAADTPRTLVLITYSELAAYPLQGFKSVLTDHGNASISDAAGGVLSITPSDATAGDNDEAYVMLAQETFLLAASKPLLFEAYVQFSEANTDDANILAGFMDAVGANALVDNGAGPKTTFSGAVLCKVDGGTKWVFVTSVSTTQTSTTSTTTAGGSSYQRLRIEITPISSTEAEARPFVDGVQLLQTNGIPIMHRITYTGATEMQAAVGVKNGGTNAETLLVDYLAAFQLR